MSFALTTRQVRAKTKIVTRRLRWKKLKAGDYIQAIEKGMGLKKGEKQIPLAIIRIKSVRTEKLLMMVANPVYGKREAIKEGFPDMSGRQFAKLFCDHNHCEPDAAVQRIEFEYL